MTDKDLLNKCLEVMAKEIPHCPKGFACIYDDWIQDRDCKVCWKNYVKREIEKEIRKGNNK